jgi:hypothetical protein
VIHDRRLGFSARSVSGERRRFTCARGRVRFRFQIVTPAPAFRLILGLENAALCYWKQTDELAPQGLSLKFEFSENCRPPTVIDCENGF